MSSKNHKAIFERKEEPNDNFGILDAEWKEVCREFGSLRPLTGRELVDQQQVQSQQTHEFLTTYSADTAQVTTACRMKIERDVLVNENEPASDVNFRIFQIQSIVNVRERNLQLQMMLVERV